MTHKLIIAHRGASAYGKDNSIDSFSNAIEMGADMLEFDVRQTSDGILIAHHDPTIRSKLIANSTYAEIKNIDGDIPTLEEVLNLTSSKIKLDIELKDRGYEKETIDQALRYMSQGDFIVTSFNVKALSAVKTYNPAIKTGLILSRYQPKNMILARLFGSLPVKWAKRLRTHYLVLDTKLANVGLLRMAKQNKLKVMVWTVNDRDTIERYLSHDDIYGIITNYPDVAVAIRESKK
jgi:glycerophosphoryl diester phosphodiesterase